jgi:hypothetical protein
LLLFIYDRMALTDFSGGFMFKRFFLAALIILPLSIAQPRAQETASEDAKTRPNRQEILDLMNKAGRTPVQQQSSRIDSIWKDLSASKTPRSDFMYCLGLAYLGNYKAQRCAGSAYEKSIGIVEDLSEAYAWYAVALENQIADKAAEETITADRDRVKEKLLAAYPHPTEDDLDDLARTQKSRVTQYQQDAKKGKK